MFIGTILGLICPSIQNTWKITVVGIVDFVDFVHAAIGIHSASSDELYRTIECDLVRIDSSARPPDTHSWKFDLCWWCAEYSPRTAKWHTSFARNAFGAANFAWRNNANRHQLCEQLHSKSSQRLGVAALLVDRLHQEQYSEGIFSAIFADHHRWALQRAIDNIGRFGSYRTARQERRSIRSSANVWLSGLEFSHALRWHRTRPFDGLPESLVRPRETGEILWNLFCDVFCADGSGSVDCNPNRI